MFLHACGHHNLGIHSRSHLTTRKTVLGSYTLPPYMSHLDIFIHHTFLSIDEKELQSRVHQVSPWRSVLDDDWVLFLLLFRAKRVLSI